MNGALTYLDEQIEAIKLHLPAAVEVFDPKSIHQARVATRRLKAGLELMSPLVTTSSKPLSRVARRVRRRLGPLRDLDVMIEHLSQHKPAPRLEPALAWVKEHLETIRRKTRLHEFESGKKPAKVLQHLEDWWKLRHALESQAAALEPVLRQSLHERFARFAEEADAVCEKPDPHIPHEQVDVHQLRIAGKALRYTFELAEAQGTAVPRKLLKQFKKMQEFLGDWHDHVVLTDTTLQTLIDSELALHEPERASQVLDLAKIFIRLGNRALLKFKSQWTEDGDALADLLQQSVPLTFDVTAGDALADGQVPGDGETANESDTDRDLPATPPAEPRASALEISEEVP